MRFTITLVVLSLLLTSCGRSDARRQRELTGTWVADFPNGLRTTCTVKPDGSYSARLCFTNGSVTTLAGRMQIKGGFIVDTCTKRSDTNAVPFVEKGYIVHIDAHEIVSRWPGSPFDTPTTMKKVGE